MLKLSEVIVGLIVVVQVASASIFSSPSKVINKHLMTMLPETQDLEDNLKAISKLKAQLSTDHDADQAVINGLSTLDDLHSAFLSPKCDDQMYKTVNESVRLVGKASLDRWTHISLLIRVQNIVRRVAFELAKVCHEKNKVELLNRTPSLNMSLINGAMRLPKMCEDTSLFNWSRNICFRDSNARISGHELRKTVLAIIKSLKAMENPELKYLRYVTDERDGKKVVRVDEVDQLIRQYVIEPCNYLMNELGDLLNRAHLDAVYSYPFYSTWLKGNKSPFLELVPTYCLCKYYSRVGDKKLVQTAIGQIHWAQDAA